MAAKKDKGGKAEKKKKPFNRYKVSGDNLEKKNKPCPKCGEESYLAEHKNRRTCGKCGYLEAI